MIQKSIFALLIIVPSIALAQSKTRTNGAQKENPAGASALAKQVDALGTSNGILNTSISELESMQGAAQLKVQAADKAMKDAYAKWRKTAGSPTAFPMELGSGDAGLRKEYDDAVKAHAEVKAKLTEIDKSLEVNRKTAQAVTRDLDKAGSDLIGKEKAMQTILESSQTQVSFLTLKAKAGETDLALERLSSYYDKSMLGAYLQDKLGLLVNSKLMCDGVERCKVKQPASIPNSEIQKILFPEGKDSTRSGSYREKAYSSQ